MSPIFRSAQRNTCEPTDPSIYDITWLSGSSIADYTIIEYSTFPNFSSTGSIILNNSNYTSSIEVLFNEFSPLSVTSIYFRAYNSCSNGSNSLYSQTVIANNCEEITSDFENFTFNIVNQSTFTVETTDGTSNSNGPYFEVPINSPIGESYNFNIATRNFFFKVASPTPCPNNIIYIELSTTTPNIGGSVVTDVNGVSTGDCNDNSGIQITSYDPSPITLQYPTTDLSTQLATNIFINRTNWYNTGNITMTIRRSDFTPGD